MRVLCNSITYTWVKYNVADNPLIYTINCHHKQLIVYKTIGNIGTFLFIFCLIFLATILFFVVYNFSIDTLFFPNPNFLFDMYPSSLIVFWKYFFCVQFYVNRGYFFWKNTITPEVFSIIKNLTTVFEDAFVMYSWIDHFIVSFDHFSLDHMFKQSHFSFILYLIIFVTSRLTCLSNSYSIF